MAQNPTQGTDLGNNTYKVRLAVESKNSGARVITYIINEQKEVYLISIYDKSEVSTIKDSDLKNIIKDFKDSIGS